MGKVIPFEKFSIKRKIKDLQNELKEFIEYHKKHDLHSIDQYKIMCIKKQILLLNEELKKYDGDGGKND